MINPIELINNENIKKNIRYKILNNIDFDNLREDWEDFIKSMDNKMLINELISNEVIRDENYNVIDLKNESTIKLVGVILKSIISQEIKKEIEDNSIFKNPEDYYIIKDNSIFKNPEDNYIIKDNSIFKNPEDNYIIKDNSIFKNPEDNYIIRDNSIFKNPEDNSIEKRRLYDSMDLEKELKREEKKRLYDSMDLEKELKREEKKIMKKNK